MKNYGDFTSYADLSTLAILIIPVHLSRGSTKCQFLVCVYTSIGSLADKFCQYNWSVLMKKVLTYFMQNIDYTVSRTKFCLD